MNFTTLVAAPTVGGEGSSAVTPFEGTLEAQIDPDGRETTYSFAYSTEEAAGKLTGTITTLKGAGPLTGIGDQTASVATGHALDSGTIYHFRVIAKNASGEAEGAGSFTTETAQAPSIAGESIFGLSATGVTLAARLAPDYQETTYAFEYSTKEASPGVLEAPIATIKGAQPLPPASGELSASVAVSDLTPGTTYYYRATATNDTGTTIDSTVQSFTTPVLALVSTGEAHNITLTTATLSGTVDPEGSETTYYFEYVSEARYQAALAEGAGGAGGDPYTGGETTVPLELSEPAGAPYTGDQPQAVGPIPAAGLRPGVTYHYRVVAQNELEGKIETSYGQDETFTTLPGTPPTVSTGAVSGVSQSSATLSGTVSTNGLQTNYGFEISTGVGGGPISDGGGWGPPTGLGSIGGAATEEVSVTLGELQPGTTYYYRVTATNADGAVQGEPGVFTTPGFPTLLTAPTGGRELDQIATPNIAFPKEEKGSTGTTTKTLTNAEKLKKALKACKREKSQSKRRRCEKQARRKYGAVKKRTRA